MRKLLITIFCICIYLQPVKATNHVETDLTPQAKASILIEPNSGKILFEKNANQRLYPASMTKMMGMILVLEAIETGKLKWDQIITVSENVEAMGGSQVYLAAGEKMSVSDLFKSISVASANDAMVCLAEEVAVTEENFVRMMNERAKKLQLKNTNFVNCTGLHDNNHYSSAYDMAIIAMELLKTYHGKILEFSSLYEDYIRTDTNKPFWLVNTNKIVRWYEGTDGLKTGYTSQSMYCITLTAKRNGLRFISVVMGSPTRDSRNNDATKLLTYGFNNYEQKLLYKENDIIDEIRIENGKIKQLPVIVKQDVPLIYSKGNLDYTYKEDIIININKAPIKKDDLIGKLVITTNEGLITESNLYAQTDIEQINIFDIFLMSLKRLLF